MDRPPKNIFRKKYVSEKSRKNNVFFLAVYQLKNTSDCIKIAPPGPGRNLKKSRKITQNVGSFFYVFAVKTRVVW